MKTLSIDIETYSDVNLAKCGVYKYAESPNFEILLSVIPLTEMKYRLLTSRRASICPQELIDALTDDSVAKWAFNANFERVGLPVPVSFRHWYKS